MQPLNGSKTHPLAPASLDALRRLAKEALPRQELNPGVANRLEREALVQSVDLPSPYASHKGRLIEHLKASPAGFAVLAVMNGGPSCSADLDVGEVAQIIATNR